MDFTDTGRGIEEKFLPHVFEMFSQEPVNFSAQSRGLGIGLALVRDLVQAHGGRIEARSPGVGQGSTFTVWLPLHNPQLATTQRPTAAAGSIQGKRVLLVDDSAETLLAFAELLRLEGVEVDTAQGGVQALECLEQHDYDLLISDIGMPGMSGLQLIAAVRSSTRSPRLPAIALSGYGREADVEKALAAGFDAHVSKPVSLDDLRMAWQRLRSRAEGEA
jgi:two-component system CheB/CheR fusion protein